LKIGFDLDNTLIDYSQAIQEYSRSIVACEARTVSELRKWFIQRNQEELWTQTQSWLYSEGLQFATITEGALEVLKRLSSSSSEFSILSHKTIFGPQAYGRKEFRKAMNEWLIDSELWDLCMGRVEYFDSLDSKVEGIRAGNFNFFVDDLRKVLEHYNFPHFTIPILFSPDSNESTEDSHSQIISIRNFASVLTLPEFKLLP